VYSGAVFIDLANIILGGVSAYGYLDGTGEGHNVGVVNRTRWSVCNWVSDKWA
jgi:hypothetical protein